MCIAVKYSPILERRVVLVYLLPVISENKLMFKLNFDEQHDGAAGTFLYILYYYATNSNSRVVYLYTKYVL